MRGDFELEPKVTRDSSDNPTSDQPSGNMANAADLSDARVAALPQVEAEVRLASATPAAVEPPASKTYQAASVEGVAEAWDGIFQAGAAYGAVIHLVVAGILMLNARRVGLGPENLFVVFWFLAALVFAMMLGALFASIGSIGAILLVGALRCSFPRHINSRVALGLLGGMSGFFATLPIWWVPAFSLSMVFRFVLVIVAIAMGYAGAVVRGRHSSPSDLFRRPMFVEAARFSVTDMLILTLFVAVLLLLAKALGWQFWVAGMVYGITQLVCLGVDELIRRSQWQNLENVLDAVPCRSESS